MKTLILLLLLAWCLPIYPADVASKNADRIIIYGDELKQDHASSFINVLTPSALEAWGSLENMLSFERGLTVQNPGPGAISTVTIRGAQSASQVLVLLDGVRLNNQLGLGVDLS